jgi:hypothetical protein
MASDFIRWRGATDKSTRRRVEGARRCGLVLVVMRGETSWGAYIQEPRARFVLVGYATTLGGAKEVAAAAAENWGAVKHQLHSNVRVTSHFRLFEVRTA